MKQINTAPVILASKSPRRKELLEMAGIAFEIRAADIDEEAIPFGGDPAGFVQTLSRLKAEAVAHDFKTAWTIGADTVVVAKGQILGKPRDPEHALSMLETLNNRTHSVFTGFTITNPGSGKSLSRAVETRVTFKPMSQAEMIWYTRTEEPYDKAGGYAIQGIGTFMVKEIDGSFSNVVGLPVCELVEALAQLNLIRY